MPHLTAYRRLLAAALALTAASLMVGRAQTGPGITDSTILIGVEGSTQAFASDEENLGMHLVARDVNSRGGVHGRLLDIRSYPRPSSATPDDVLANVKKLVEQDGVFLIFNHGGPSAMSIAPYAMRLKVPYMFPHTALVTADADRYVFTSYPRYLGESQVMLRYLSGTRGFKRIGIVHDANVYGRYFLDRLLEYAPRFGYAVAGTLALTERKPGDLREALATVRRASPEAVVLALYPEQAQAVMDARSRLEWSGVRMVSSGPLTDEQYLNVPRGFAEGTLGFCYYPDPNVAREPGVERYRQLMARYYPDHPLNRYSLYGYVYGRLVVEGLQRAGRQLTREGFIDAMESVRGWDSGGIMPPVSFSTGNHHAQRAGFMCELRNGRFESLGDWIEP